VAGGVGHPRPPRPLARGLDGLIGRECELLALIRLIGRGLSNAEIGDHLHLSAAAVKHT